MTSFSPSTLLSRRAQLVASGILVALIVGAVAVLWSRGLSRGWSSDEVALVQPWPIGRIFSDPEGAANPPLQRMIVNTIAPAGSEVYWGRLLSFSCACAAASLAFAVGRRLSGGNTLAGLAVATLVAVNPFIVEHAGLFRSYAAWVAVALWHVHALIGVVAGDKPRRSEYVSATVSAALLPWLHYSSIPILILEAAGILALAHRKWRRLWIFAPAALLVLPLVPIVLGDPSRREPGSWDHVNRAMMYALSAGWHDAGTLVGAWIIPTLLLVHRHPLARRLLLVGFLAVLVTTLIMTPLALVRSPAALFSLPFVAPLIVASAFGPGNRWHQLASLVLILLVTLTSVRASVRLTRTMALDRDGVKQFAMHWRQWDPVRAGRPIYIHPSYQAGVVFYYLKQLPMSAALRPDWCGNTPLCFAHDGERFIGVDSLQQARGGLVVSFEDTAPRALASRCKTLSSATRLHVYDCAGPETNP